VALRIYAVQKRLEAGKLESLKAAMLRRFPVSKLPGLQAILLGLSNQQL